MHTDNIKSKKMLLIIKAKYDVIEPYYMEGSIPEQLAKHVDEPECWKVSLTDSII